MYIVESMKGGRLDVGREEGVKAGMMKLNRK